jgi:N-terminal domain on NACHT_NTPase and P-loop NTPases
MKAKKTGTPHIRSNRSWEFSSEPRYLKSRNTSDDSSYRGAAAHLPSSLTPCCNPLPASSLLEAKRLRAKRRFCWLPRIWIQGGWGTPIIPAQVAIYLTPQQPCLEQSCTSAHLITSYKLYPVSPSTSGLRILSHASTSCPAPKLLQCWGWISSIISIVDGFKQIYDATTNAQGLPEAFRDAAGRLPIVRNILGSAKQHIGKGHVDESSCTGVKLHTYTKSFALLPNESTRLQAAPGPFCGCLRALKSSLLRR